MEAAAGAAVAAVVTEQAAVRSVERVWLLDRTPRRLDGVQR